MCIMASLIHLYHGEFNSHISIWVFFHEYSWFTGQQGNGEAISLSRPLYYFHPLHRHLGIGRVITGESSLLHIASSQTWTRNLSKCNLLTIKLHTLK